MCLNNKKFFSYYLYSTKSLKLIRENSYDNAVLAYDRDSLNFPKDRVSSFSILMTNSEFNLVNFIEKPTQEQVEQNLDDNGKIITKIYGDIFKKFFERKVLFIIVICKNINNQ